MDLTILWVIWALGFGVVTALAAAARGRSGAAWFVLGLAFGLFALLAVLVMRPVEPAPESPWPSAVAVAQRGAYAGRIYKGRTIRGAPGAWEVDGKRFDSIVEAERHIDMLS